MTRAEFRGALDTLARAMSVFPTTPAPPDPLPSGAASFGEAALPVVTLRGSVRDLGVADVVGMIAAGRRSGALTVESGGAWQLVFVAGDVVAGASPSPLALVRNLLARGLMTPEQAQELLGVSDPRRPDGRDPEVGSLDALVFVCAAISAAVAAPHVRSHAVAVAFEMLGFHDGEITFAEFDPDLPAWELAVGAADVLDAAAAQRARWGEVTGVVGDESTRLRRVRRVTADSAPVILDAVEWAALAEIDERATVGQIGHRLGLGRYEALLLAESLLDRGLVEHAA